MARSLKNSNTLLVTNSKTASSVNTKNPLAATSLEACSPLELAVQRAMPHVAAGHYEKALSVLAAGGSTPEVQNARGVCLLRLGRYEDAVRLFRGLVLQAGGTWSRSDVPPHYKTNFATALLLNGHPSGCLSVLEEMRVPDFPPVMRLREALTKWQSTLSFLQRLNWRIGRIEPAQCQITIDFPPGDFGDSLCTHEAEKMIR